MSSPATRLTDFDEIHCSRPIRGEASDDVFVNGLGWSRFGDRNIIHLKPYGDGCGPHQAPITDGSETVFINGRAAGHIGSDVGGPGCTFVVQGSPDVFVGE